MRSIEQLICVSHCKICYFLQNPMKWELYSFNRWETQPREKNEFVQCHRPGKEHNHCSKWEPDLDFAELATTTHYQWVKIEQKFEIFYKTSKYFYLSTMYLYWNHCIC